MAQLVELKKSADKFTEQGVEVIAIFREEADGVAGLDKIRERTSVEFSLGLDTGAEKTARYSPGRMEFTNYVIGSDGVIQGVIEGDLRNRANSEQLIQILESLTNDE